MERKRIAVIGGGPACMMAADVLAPFHDVVLFEQGKTIGRKFLVAGQGGFNLSNELEGGDLRSKYYPAGFLDAALNAFGPAELREWLAEMGIETYIGSSGRVFPVRGIKPITVLQSIRDRLVRGGVRFELERCFVGFDEHIRPIMEQGDARSAIDADIIIFGLGGASWPVTGSSGSWTEHFDAIGIRTLPWRSSNCGVQVVWSEKLVHDHAGKPLKNITITVAGKRTTGEATLTEYGLEGNAIYPLVPEIRAALSDGRPATLHLDLKPNNSVEQLISKVEGRSTKQYARALNLDRQTMALLKEVTNMEDHHDAASFVRSIKQLAVPVCGLRPLDEAISTVGGIPCSALNSDLSLRLHPNLFTIGEMVDWDAPTGGFLLQGCFAMGHHAGRRINERYPRHSASRTTGRMDSSF